MTLILKCNYHTLKGAITPWQTLGSYRCRDLFQSGTEYLQLLLLCKGKALGWLLMVLFSGHTSFAKNNWFPVSGHIPKSRFIVLQLACVTDHIKTTFLSYSWDGCSEKVVNSLGSPFGRVLVALTLSCVFTAFTECCSLLEASGNACFIQGDKSSGLDCLSEVESPETLFWLSCESQWFTAPCQGIIINPV